MIILAFESSCDETAAAISRNGREILSDVVYSQADMHLKYGGVVPEIASRKHIEKIRYVAEEAVKNAGLCLHDIDAVAATCAPGLIGALLVGANYAKACAMALEVPFIPVHHIRAHIAAAYIAYPELQPPFTALVASGGHTVIIDVADYTAMEVLGTTRDDAAGEAFDKIARYLGLGYPGGAKIDEIGKAAPPGTYKLPLAVVENAPLDMSFSGVKTACLNIINTARQKGTEPDIRCLASDLAYAISRAIVPRLIKGAKIKGRDRIVAAGGVAANSTLRRELLSECDRNSIQLYLPPLKLCGDNGSMVAAQAYYELLAQNAGELDQNCFATMSVSDSFSTYG